MTTILSYGGGVNSTAILAFCKLGELPWPDYIVFSDTGAEWPHTYKYLDYLENEGIDIIYLTGGKFSVSLNCPGVGFSEGTTLIEWCQQKSFIPSRINRWCTDYWKRAPIEKFCKGFHECEQWIGIDAGEAHRAERKGKDMRFPLVEMGIDRRGCKKIIKKAGWGVPQKSGCFICPYQRKAQWIRLKKEYPDLWNLAVSLENNARARNPGFNFKDIPIEQYVADLDRQEELPFDIELDQRCECYFD